MKKTIASISNAVRDGKYSKPKHFAKNGPHDNFHRYVDEAFWMAAHFIHDKSTSSSREKKIATSNLIANHVTAIEVYFRHIISLNSNWSQSGIETVMKEKVLIGDAYNLIKKGNVKLEHLIAQTFSFNDLSAIELTMNALTACTKDFWVEVEEFENLILNTDSKAVTSRFIDLYPDWWNSLELMYQERNNYVHEGILCKWDPYKVADINHVVTELIDQVSGYLFDNYSTKD